MPSFMKRLSQCTALARENAWLTKMNGGRGYDVHCLAQELDSEIAHGIPGIRPTRTGLWLIVLGMELSFYARLAWYAVSGRGPIWLFAPEEEPEPFHGRTFDAYYPGDA